jgi:hypothetical protein
MRFVEFQNLIPGGATRPCLCKTDTAELWVIKVHGNPLGTKAIFNEYVAGRLAEMIELPWPTVCLGELSDTLVLRLAKEGLNTESKLAVGIKYVDGIRKVDWPKNANPLENGFDRINAQHIKDLFSDTDKWQAFYGKSVFDNWVLLGDTKYDTLYIDKSGSPLFLDASIALGGLEWDMGKLHWDLAGIFFEHSPYLQGILTDRDQFAAWMKRIEGIKQGCIEKLLTEIPKEWRISQGYLSACVTFLSSSKENFVPLFREFIRWA